MTSNNDQTNDYTNGSMLGDYVLKERLGGSQSVVFKAIRKIDSKEVVVKIFPNTAYDNKHKKMYENEVKVREKAGKKSKVLEILDKGTNQNDEYIVMEFIEGGSLSELLEKNSQGIPIKKVLQVFTPVANALDELHETGIVHRDIKPKNILVNTQRDEVEIFIIDFSDARFTDSSEEFKTDTIAGTAQYIAPEAFTLNPKTKLIDIYAFGIMLYMAFEGRTPFGKSRMPPPSGNIIITDPIPYPEKTRYNNTKGAADVVLWTMSDNPYERPRTTREVINILRKIFENHNNDEQKWFGRKFKNYIVLDILYIGRVSPTLLALDIWTRREVVLKTFDKDSLTGNAKASFENEMYSLNKLNENGNPNYVRSAHVLTPIDDFEQDGIFFIVNEYLPNGTFRDLLKKEPTLDIQLNVLTQIAEAIDFVHKNNLIHRDIKPENIVYQKHNDNYQVFLTDFGIAKILDHSSTYSTKFNTGTKYYMAPENWNTGARKTKAVDIYAFGVMLYEVFEGDVPFKGTEEQLIKQHLNDSVPDFKNRGIKIRPNAQKIILSMLEKDPSLRPKSALTEINRLKEILSTPIADMSNKSETAQILITDPTKSSVDKGVPLDDNVSPSDTQPSNSWRKYMLWPGTPILIVLTITIYFCILLAGNFHLSFQSAPPTFTLTLPSPTLTNTPTSNIFNATIKQPGFCYNGPNKSYLGAIPLVADVNVDILAISDTGDWFMIFGEKIDPCWVEEKQLNIPISIDLNDVDVFTTFVTTENTYCRVYPESNRNVQTIIPNDRRLVVYGKVNADGTWLLVIPHDSTNLCWIENKSKTNPPVPIEGVPDALQPTVTFTLTPARTGAPFLPTNTRTNNDDNNNPTVNASPIIPTSTLRSPTATLIPPPTSTPIPPPTSTPIPLPTSTPIPPSTATKPPPSPCPTKPGKPGRPDC